MLKFTNSINVTIIFGTYQYSNTVKQTEMARATGRWRLDET